MLNVIFLCYPFRKDTFNVYGISLSFYFLFHNFQTRPGRQREMFLLRRRLAQLGAQRRSLARACALVPQVRLPAHQEGRGVREGYPQAIRATRNEETEAEEAEGQVWMDYLFIKVSARKVSAHKVSKSDNIGKKKSAQKFLFKKNKKCTLHIPLLKLSRQRANG